MPCQQKVLPVWMVGEAAAGRLARIQLAFEVAQGIGMDAPGSHKLPLATIQGRNFRKLNEFGIG